ncbi:hypothetical protein B0T16DRAFT_458168 [Cercophora newfieldiana]|uniref:NTF2 domain-containing protein n=1 Tax=Cercophora newfieldiana TaxID=92897 RepID=A0AA40CQY5_9PEZI|nr:hypothetical protein B0T16DRAFT_458168 [Cercophora newfieldiana]
MATNGVNHEQYAAPQTTETAANSGSKDLPKDEVGWYFVEQYYTTLSKNPEKLHLFYSKKSQFVYGQETEIVSIALGRPAIQERIKALEFENCKVCISNVDSQGSDDNIVIQVIGETSNKGAPPKKFVQTFVLAKQPSGYFVLNDILRYINEDTEEETEESAQATISEVPAPVETEEQAEEQAPAQEEPVKEAEPAELDAVVVDQKLEEADSLAVETSTATAETVAAAPLEETPEPAEEQAESIPEPEKVVEEIAEEEAKKPEEPKDPNPTPAVPAARAPPTPVVAEPEKPKEAPKPMTWASRAAAAAGPPRAVVPIPKTATPPVPAQARQPAPSATAAPPVAQAAETAPTSAAAPKDQGSEWQTAETKRQSRPQSMSAAPAEKEGAMAYIKYVTDKVRDEDLKNALAVFGELAYFDINRGKNCAFVEFKSQAGYNAAVAANPHTVNGENIIVEQRRPKANAYGGSNYSSTRGGGVPGRGRGGFEPQRSGSQGAGRGGFTGQTRGRGGPPRGRGASQAGTA